MTNFPEYIEINFQGYNEELIPNLYVSEFESGPSKKRRRSTNIQKLISFTGFICGKENYQSFVSWYRDDISQGSDWFLFTDPFDYAVKRARISNDTLQAQPFQADSNVDLKKWEVGFQIEVWE